MNPELLEVLRKRIDQEMPHAIDLRHRLHTLPDLSGAEGPTLDLVLKCLPGFEHARPVANTGALLRIGGPGEAIAVRAELDALPAQEESGLEWASQRPGVMHACGHDVHLAAAVALARAVDATDGAPPILLVLQPREETYPSGAKDICASGMFAEEGVRATVAAHVQPTLAGGTVACTSGSVNASSDEFVINIHGKGGHAAYPHITADPVVALAHVVISLQNIVSRNVDPMDPVVLTIATLQAGTAANVIPGTAAARGTVRTMSVPVREEVLRRLEETVLLVASAHGCSGEVTVTEGEPVLENNEDIAKATTPLLQSLALEVDGSLRSAGSDDFSYYSEKVPSLMMFVGTSGVAERLHSSTFVPGDGHVQDVAYALLAGYVGAAITMLRSSELPLAVAPAG
ncbi:M20 family metallopeptidase [Paenarthrobacter sp. NPDC092416]|uniref:M20 metallopeptidase family protein n=1 Tax=Paenarthrobacter sp. NPDC092416 TaxID=3364386 RepID=UPI00381A028B